jgi:leucyl-tRNA synthetase
MSKSLGNVINPDDIVKEYGTDVLRLYEMFMGPLEDSKVWNTKSIVGLKRFLERVWKLKSVISDQESVDNNLETLIHKTIKKVTEDIENLRFNTAISSLMILLNEMEKQKKLSTVHRSLFIQLLSPFAPHIAEEIWRELGHKLARRRGEKSIFLEKWPKYDAKLVVEKEANIVVQVNGKVRDQIEIVAGAGEREVKELALASEKIKKYISNADSIRKVVFVPGRLINFVI